MTPEEMAEHIVFSRLHGWDVVQELKPDDELRAAEKMEREKVHTNESATSALAQGNEAAEITNLASADSQAVSSIGLYGAMDPRLKWILYILLVTASMLQHRWLGLSLTLVPVALALAALPRQALAGCVKLMKPLLLFFLISTALSGTTLSTERGGLQFGFSLMQAEATLLNVYRLLIVTLVPVSGFR